MFNEKAFSSRREPKVTGVAVSWHTATSWSLTVQEE
jgi:hypothetical protein